LSPIAEVFRKLRDEGALIAYVMGGDPDLETSAAVIDAVVRGGADILEVGIPFSDPIADGKSIQAASLRSLSSGATPSQILDLIKDAKFRHPFIPIAAMTYYNILFSNGLDGFLAAAKNHGADGLIVPDLPFDEIRDYARLAKRHGLDGILLAAPTSAAARMGAIARQTSGFLYLVSLLGVTGARSAVQEGVVDLIHLAKRNARGVPLGVGFGISSPEQVRVVLRAGADGVIVGSGIVDRVANWKNGRDKMLADVEGYVRSLKEATTRV